MTDAGQDQTRQGQTTDERVEQLEAQVDALVQALHALIDGLERGPASDPGDRTARGARLARELLLARGL